MKNNKAAIIIIIAILMAFCHVVYMHYIKPSLTRSDNKIIELCIKERVYCNIKIFAGSVDYYISLGEFSKGKIKNYEEAKFFIDSVRKF
jgi:hypothetical protein